MKKFLDKFAKLIEKTDTKYQDPQEHISLLHETIKKITYDIDEFKFNTAISQLMIVTNTLSKADKISQNYLEKLIILIAPFAPHLAEEMWSLLGHKEMVYQTAEWPEYDEDMIVHETIMLPIQINGKVRGKIEIDPESKQEDIIKLVRDDEKIAKHLPDPIKKVIYINGKILNIVG